MDCLNHLDTLKGDKTMSLFEAITSVQPKIKEKPPQDLIEFRALGRLKKKDLLDNFYKQDHIQEYLDKKWKVDVHNMSSILWLCDYKNICADENEKHAIEMKIDQFLKVIEDQKDVFIALRIDLDKHNLKPVKDFSEVNWDD